MTYTAFTYKATEELETFGLFPNSTDCSIIFGFFNPDDKSLTLKSKDKIQELKSFQKMNELGEGLVDKQDKDRVLVERRMVENNLQFAITNFDDVKAWLDDNVKNKEILTRFLN